MIARAVLAAILWVASRHPDGIAWQSAGEPNENLSASECRVQCEIEDYSMKDAKTGEVTRVGPRLSCINVSNDMQHGTTGWFEMPPQCSWWTRP